MSGLTTTPPLTGDGSSGNPLSILPASAASRGALSIADFNKLATVPTGPALIAWGRTAVIDFLAPIGADYVISLPILAAREVIGFVGRLRVVTRVGTATGGVDWTIGSNVTKDNFVPTGNGGLQPVTINSTPGGPGGVIALGTGILAADISTTQMSVRTSIIPTGMTAYSGYILYAVSYVA